MKLEEITCGLQNPGFLSDNIIVVLLAASRQGFKYCTWFISSKMYRNTEDKIRNLRKDINRNYNQSRNIKTNRK